MRVVLTCPYSLRRITGIGVFVVGIVSTLARLGHGAWIVCPGGVGDLLRETPSATEDLVEIPSHQWRKLRDVVLSIGTARVLFMRRREYDVIHTQQPHLQSLVAILVAKLCGRKSVTTLHGRLPRPANFFRLLLLNLLEKAIFAFSDTVVYVSNQTRADFGVERGVVILNGADERLFRFDSDLRHDARREIGVLDEFVILFLSRLAPMKGIGDALSAFAQLSHAGLKAKLLIVGDGLPQEEMAVSTRIKELGIQSMTLSLGARVDRRPWFEAADAYVLPSHREGLPLALLEAMSVGVPCIVTPVGGMRDVIEDGANGLVVPEGDPTALAGAILRYARDPEFRSTIGNRARATIVERFTLSRMVREYVVAYASS